MTSDARDRPKLTPQGQRTRTRIVEAAARLMHPRSVAGTTRRLSRFRTTSRPEGPLLTASEHWRSRFTRGSRQRITERNDLR